MRISKIDRVHSTLMKTPSLKAKQELKVFFLQQIHSKLERCHILLIRTKKGSQFRTNANPKDHMAMSISMKSSLETQVSSSP
jgi:predicted MPP superfamily phosphohydrolase